MPAVTTANLLAWAVQVAVIVSVGGLLPSLLRVDAPRLRLAYWRALLFVCLALPFVQPAPSSVTPPAGADMAALAAPGAALTADAVAGTGAGALGAAPAGWPIGTLAAAVLLAGVVARLAWLGLGMITLVRLRRVAPLLLPRPEAVQEACELVGADAEFRSAPGFVRPVTFGVKVPVVMLPDRFSTLSANEQKAIACHELVHVKRHDWLRAAADEIVRALGWFHPAIWWLLDQIHLTREQVVDGRVVSLVGSRQAYLQALLRLAGPGARPALRPVSLFLKHAHLRQRVALLMKESRMSKTRLAAAFVFMAAVVAASGHLTVNAVPLELLPPDVAVAAIEATGGGQATKPDAAALARLEAEWAAAAAARAASRTGVAAGVQGGVAGGLLGGVEGGVAGGVQGGVVTRQTVLRALTRVDPLFAGTVGMAVVEVVVDINGFPSVVNVTSSDPQIELAAADAARNWTFEPPKEPVTAYIGFNVTEETTSAFTAPPSKVGGFIQSPRKIKDVKPVYPPEVLAKGAQGVQILEATISETGTVRNSLSLRSTDPSLIVAATEAVLQWKFTPAVLDGAPKPVLMTVTVNFAASAASSMAFVAGATTTGKAPAEWPAGAVRVGGNIRQPMKMVDVKPVYPDLAQKARVQGVVIVEALIGQDGRVEGARVLRSIPLLDQAALDAVRQWEFNPTLMNGVPVPVIMTLTVNFTLQ